jgi:hypothetical protein
VVMKIPNFSRPLKMERKTRNTIWRLKDSLGNEVSTFKDLAQLGKNHFQNLFKAPEGTSIAEIIYLALPFPSVC